MTLLVLTGKKRKEKENRYLESDIKIAAVAHVTFIIDYLSYEHNIIIVRNNNEIIWSPALAVI